VHHEKIPCNALLIKHAGWQHIACMAGRVVNITLRNAGLQGTLPPLAGGYAVHSSNSRGSSSSSNTSEDAKLLAGDCR
jgi:hypothetical protein